MTALKVLLAAVKMLHPFMPFVTEEIWQKLPATKGSIMTANFPNASDFIKDEKSLKEMDLLMGVITGIRNIRGEMNIKPSVKVNAVIDLEDKGQADIFERNLNHIGNLATVNNISISSGEPKPEASATALFEQNQVHVILKGLLNFEEEKNRLKKEIKKIENEMSFSEKKLSNKGFLEKAPEEVVKEVREKVETLTSRLSKLNQNLSFFETIND